jgi:hypothetical protein
MNKNVERKNKSWWRLAEAFFDATFLWLKTLWSFSFVKLVRCVAHVGCKTVGWFRC